MSDAFADAQFCYPWRDYQARVLGEMEDLLDDERLHIVAAPGSGKTVLGLEVMKRFDRPALILAPTITVRDQWIGRFTELFLPHETRPEWISTDLRQPGAMTAATYQALHTIGRASNSELIPTLQEAGVRTIILDEAHHLRSAWWETLQEAVQQLQKVRVVALTATPPYDVDTAEWDRYRQLCGAIDTEVSVPELVLRGDLCPHQDLLYLSTPTESELARILHFRRDVAQFRHDIVQDEASADMIRRHPWIAAPDEHMEELLEDPRFFSSMLIYLNAADGAIQREYLEILGVSGRKIPSLDLTWLQRLLDGCLHDYSEKFENETDTLERIRSRLRRIGALRRRHLDLQTTREVRRTLGTSTSKLNSIAEIAQMEAEWLGDELRMVILTDYIRREYLPSTRHSAEPISEMGAVPIFEILRRRGIDGLRPALLTGSLIILPEEACETLQTLLDTDDIDVTEITRPVAGMPGFVQLAVDDVDGRDEVRFMTELFSLGQVNCIVGTAALLGEGWDAPSINTLVLASFVSSYMLSNQMRGRAIRTWSQQPDKTANIWHLACIEPGREDGGDDWQDMRRRFRSFVAPSFERDTIENGLDRLGISDPPFTGRDVSATNARMTALGTDRRALVQRWDRALHIPGSAGSLKRRVVQQVQASDPPMPRGMVFRNTLAALMWEGIGSGIAVGSLALRVAGHVEGGLSVILPVLSFGGGLAALAALPKCLKAIWLAIKHGPIRSSMAQIGRAVVQALCRRKIIRTPEDDIDIVSGKRDDGTVYCTIRGATSPERAIYVEALTEVLNPVENPRYLLVGRNLFGRLTKTNFYAVPSVLGANRDSADTFAKTWSKHVAPSVAVYTRNTDGRKLLLRARSEAFSAEFQSRADRISVWE